MKLLKDKDESERKMYQERMARVDIPENAEDGSEKLSMVKIK